VFRRALQQWRRDLKRLDEMRIKVHRTEGDSTDFSVDCQVRAARFTCENEPCIHTNTHTHTLSLSCCLLTRVPSYSIQRLCLAALLCKRGG